MRIAVFASGRFALPALRSVHNSSHDIACVITQPPRPAGRGRKPRPTPVAEFADAETLELWTTERVNEPDTVSRLGDLQLDLGLVIAFGQKLGPPVMSAFRSGCVNLHASLLPRYRGAAPIQWAIMRGEPHTGVTVFRLTDRMDAGPILAARQTMIRPDETADELHDRLARIGPDAVGAALVRFQDDPNPAGIAQDDAEATRAPKLTKRDGYVTFNQPAMTLARTINGLWSWPGATAEYVSADGRRRECVTLARARVAQSAEPPIGECGVLGHGLHVASPDGWLEILEIRPQAGRVLAWPEFVNGRRTRPGDRFTAVSDSLQ